MAAATLVLGVLAIVTTSATPGNVRLVNLPVGTRWVRVKPRASQCKGITGFAGADEAAIGAAAYEDLYADQVWGKFVGGHAPTFGLASTAAAVDCEVTAMVEGP